MDLHISRFTTQLSGQIQLTSSKSESNRALIMNALSSGLDLQNLSDARDTQTMLTLLKNDKMVWDVLDAGTTMRFCTALLAIIGNGQEITGTERMKQRPIGLLVEALRQIGAKIDYLGEEGYPPLKIHKVNTQLRRHITIPGTISSQFISALLMIAPRLPQGLTLELTGTIFSRPYIEMTLGLMSHFGITHTWQDNLITVPAQTYQPNHYRIESDWSGASYWYSMVALNPGAAITLRGLNQTSYQGDQAIVGIMASLGVGTTFTPEGVALRHQAVPVTELTLDFIKCPDLAQTVMVTAALQGVTLHMTGLESLRIKETDRIGAMQAELTKLGATLSESPKGWTMTPGKAPEGIPVIETYEDHRMAMAFAPVAMVRDIRILDKEVVNKSYPAFWNDLQQAGIQFHKI
ncbi:MAG: 3-phosphoshikimate 1-carboxyvinyltransferase [Cyclobacteriaceae bacterium]|nr:3-phosphoshikimate 1-carboxyvinyltransferase [Cyclobacteriaceae bacterium]